ncbi:Holliday junction resolvase RecU [Anaerocolumna chitinilytica]|uniref:Holliday junction resolvase RecU n=1 Tax=Anaerocolumna chitinilytica TaxID=1727145 RepID=A0A7I8DP82_9FIRM|nr:Holliday junction resolvase RecU [Anaerocolumna chitinilytica]BCK00113.1 Holliday junction resolvase RecU [Anaerocolumna chitinilytica]
MPSWNSRGLRGSALEELINLTNTKYREKNLALIQKIPTPITPITIDKENRHITLAYFEEKSTVDYIGTAQGIPVCFDAKECASDTFALQNVHEHQVEFMKDFEKQGGIAFLLIYYSKRNYYYYLPLKDLLVFWNRAKEGGRKSFRFEELDADNTISCMNSIYIHYLVNIAKDAQNREKQQSC